MRLLVSALLWAWVLLWGTVLSLAGLVLFVIVNPLVDPRRRLMDRVCNLWARGILAVAPGLKVEVVGLERLEDGDEPLVLCANHQSAADIVMLLAAYPHFKFIAKPALFWTPPLGIQLWLAGYIPAATGEPGGAERVARAARRWLGRGVHVMVFPEGTRSPTERTLRFRQGPFVMAKKAGVRVLPVAIHGTGRLLSKRAFTYHLPARVRVEYLEPLSSDGEPKVIAAEVRSRIEAALAR